MVIHIPECIKYIRNSWTQDTMKHSYCVKVLCLTRHKIGHFGDIPSSQSFGLVWKKLNITQQKETTKEQNGKTYKSWQKHTQKAILNLNQQSTARIAHTCVHMTVYNCSTQDSTEQFWWSSLLSSRQSSLLRCCLLERRGQLQWTRLHMLSNLQQQFTSKLLVPMCPLSQEQCVHVVPREQLQWWVYTVMGTVASNDQMMTMMIMMMMMTVMSAT